MELVPPDEKPDAEVEPSQSPFDHEDSVPEDIVDAAKAAFARRSRGELAALVYDSLVDDKEPPEDHVLRFEHERFRFEVNVSVRPADVDMTGLVSPSVGGRFELVIEQGELSFVFDSSDGSFSFGPVGHGLVRLSFESPDGSNIQTDWFRI